VLWPFHVGFRLQRLVHFSQEDVLPVPDVVTKSLGIHGSHHVDVLALASERPQLLNEPLDVRLLEGYPIAQDIIPEEDRQSLTIASYLVNNALGPGHRTGHPAEYEPAVSRLIDGPGDFATVAHLRAEETHGRVGLAEVTPVGLVILHYLPEHLVLRNERQNGMILCGTYELQSPHFRQFSQPVDHIRHAMLIQHLGEHGIDIDGHLGVRLFMKKTYQRPVGLIADLFQHAVELG